MASLPRTPLQRALALAQRQYGLLTTRDAVACGLSDDQVERFARSAGWQRLARGLYALPGSVPSWRRDAMGAVLLGGPHAVASHLTAAALWGLCRAPVLPHVLVPRSASSRTRLARVHRGPLPPVDRARREGIPCTSAARTVVDAAGIVERPVLAGFLDDLFCSKVSSPDAVLRALRRAGTKGRLGALALQSEVEVWTEDIQPDTPAEARFVRMLLGLGADGVRTQHEVGDDEGRFVARLDVAIPGRRHGFEYDSDRWHNPRHWARDEARYARLRAIGWRVDPVCKLDLLPSSTRLAELLAAYELV